MKKTLPFLWSAALIVGLAAGCGHLDLTPSGDPHRVLMGTVDFEGPVALPDDAVVVVRVIDAVPPTSPSQAEATNNLASPHPARPIDPQPAVLGEQTIRHPGVPPIAFRVEYEAEDDQLRHGLNIEARVSYGGKVHYFNFNHYAIGSTDYTEPHTITVNPIAP